MFLNYLLLIGLIAMAIMTTTYSLTTEQAELIPVRANDTEIETRRINVN